MLIKYIPTISETIEIVFIKRVSLSISSPNICGNFNDIPMVIRNTNKTWNPSREVTSAADFKSIAKFLNPIPANEIIAAETTRVLPTGLIFPNFFIPSIPYSLKKISVSEEMKIPSWMKKKVSQKL